MTFWRFRRITDAARLGGSVYVLALAITVAILVYAPSPAQALLNNGEPASDILGQFTSVSSDTTADYVKGCPNNGASQIGFDTNAGSVIDSVNHWMFVPEQYNNRVVVFPLNSSNQISSKTPSYVLGQTNFTTCAQNQGNSTPSASSLNMGQGSLCVDSTNQRLYVPDWGNNRVLVFSTSSMSNGENASYELGQPSGGTAFTTYAHATTQSGLYGPEACTYDSTNQLLYVADYDNNRVMVFSTASLANGENASYVLGQSGYGSATAATTQAGMSGPNGVTLDSSDHQLYVSDSTNNRILEFNTTSLASGMNASTVFGQSSYGSGSANEGGSTSQIGLSAPGSLAYDSVNYRLFASDTNNNRALVFNTANVTNDENATDILGQFTSPSSDVTPDYVKSCVNNGASQIGFNAPDGGTIDPTNHWLFIADQSNNRVLVFPLNSSTNLLSSKTASYVLGQTNFVNCSPNQGNGTGNTNGTQSGLYLSNIGYTALAVDPVNQLLYVPDYGNNRVMVFSTASMSNGENASYVIGQSNFTNSNYSTSQSRLTSPTAAALDNTNHLLYVADSGNNRVMIFPAYGNGSWAGSSENALYEIGQPSGGTAFTSSTAATTQSGLSYPVGVAVDVGNSLLYVADEHNNRVVIFPVPVASNGENASYELGQASGGTAFTSKTSGTGQSGMNGDYAVTLDTTNSRLFVGDYGSNRILIFPAYGNASWAGNGENASFELGETSWTAGQGNQGQNSFDNFSSPGGMIYDSTNSLLYVADAPDNRVMIFNVAPNPPTPSSPAMDGNDACAIAGGSTGALYCWGENNEGEDGLGNTTGYEIPQLVGSATNWTAVSQGDPDYDTAACGIAGGALYCWGHNNYGELGLGNTTQYTTPQQVGTDTTWTAISVSGYDSCGIDNGKLYCWGFNTNGEDGQGNTTQYKSPVQVGVATNWTAVSTGNAATCGIAGGALYCWGNNQFGELGLGNTTNFTSPQQVGVATNCIAISQGFGDTCGIRGSSGSGALYCWGANSVGELGLGGVTSSTVFVTSTTYNGNFGTPAATAIANANADCAARATAAGLSGTYLAWIASIKNGSAGANDPFTTFVQSVFPYKEVNGTVVATNWTKLVSGTLTNAITLSESGGTVSGDVWSNVATTGKASTNGNSTTKNCAEWSNGAADTGNYGVIGSATASWTFLTADTATCSTTNSLYCFQQNANPAQQNSPVQVGTDTTWSAISIQNDNSTNADACGIDNGKLYCWGQNANGEDGLGNTTQYTTPQQVGVLTTWTAVSYGGNNTCGIAGNQLYCWGQNHFGQDGIGNATQQTTPAAVSGVGDIGNDEDATDLLGEYNSTSSTATLVWTQYGQNNGPTALGFIDPAGIALDTVHHQLFVSDSSNNRVLVYTLTSSNTFPSGSGGHTASYVLGQTGLQGYNSGGSGLQAQLCNTNGLAVDTVNSRLFVADNCNNRVIVFSTPVTSNGPNAIGVLGNTVYNWVTATHTQSTFNGPYDVAYDSVNQNLYVADYGNNRVLVFSVPPGFTNGENASYEFGQPSGGSEFTTHASADTQSGMNGPSTLAYDSVNSRLFVNDQGNNRVLVFSTSSLSDGPNATNVIGQSSFTTAATADTQTGLHEPSGIAYDATDGWLFVADCGNGRVLEYNAAAGALPTNNASADFVLGAANFVSGSTGNAPTQSSLDLCQGAGGQDTPMTYDPSNARLFVSDEYNNRVMIFNAQTPGEPVNDEAASYVLGQTNFTNSNGSNIGYSNVSQSGLSTPNGVAFDPTNDLLYVDDSYNSRLMQFNVASGTLANGENASDLLGEYSSPTSTATVEWTQNGPNNGPTALGMSIFNDISQPAGYVTLDPVNHYLYVADNNNNRVMIYALNTDNSIPTASGGHTATYVLGQTSLQGGSNANCTASTMDAPMGLAYDSVNNRLFVVQQNQARVLVFDNMSTPSNGMAASYVLGEPNLTTCGYGNTASQSQFGTPWGVAYDAVNQRLFVVDNGWTAGGQGNRVLVFNVAPGTIANGENASYVLGQSNFTNTGTGTTATTMYGPIDAAYDPVNTRLFVSDENNNRVLVFNVPTSVTNGTSYGEAASYVLGASNFTTTGSYGCNNSSTGAPQGLAYDANNSRLFVAQTDCNNVMVFNVAPGGIQNGENASYELGHTNFTSNSSGTSQTQFSSGGYVYYDPGSGRLFVGDSTNNRILIFEGSFGDPNFFLLMPD